MRSNWDAGRRGLWAVGIAVALIVSTTSALGPGMVAAGGATCGSDPVNAALVDAGVVQYTEDPAGGTWQTWTVGPGDVDVPAPPATAGAQTALELAELHRLALARTTSQIDEALEWDQGAAGDPWSAMYLDLIVEHGLTGKRNPPRLSREMAILHTAIYDALVITFDAKYCYVRPAPYVLDPALPTVGERRPLPSYPSEHAAVAGVASVVMRAFFSTAEEPVGSLEELAMSAAESRMRAGLNYRSDVEAGFAIGQTVANAVLSARSTDGSAAVWDGSGRIEGKCNWKPTPPAFQAAPLEPVWGKVRPWLMTTGSQFRAPPPPECDEDEYLAAYRDVYETSLTLTERQAGISDYWEAGKGTVTPPGMSLQVAMDKIHENGLTTLRTARVMSYVSTSLADAAIACWDTKYTYWFDRPVTAIRRLWEDDWTSHAVTPPFPGYVSGHSTFTGAGMQTLMYFFPQDTPELRAYQTEAALARFYGGIHFRPDNDQGIEIGIKIGELAAARAAADGVEA